MCPKSLVLVLFRIPQELFAFVARETELARVFDLHLLPEQDQLGVAPVCVIVLDLANVFVMINPPAWRYKLFWSPVHFFVSIIAFITSTNTTQEFTRTQFTYHLQFSADLLVCTPYRILESFPIFSCWFPQTCFDWCGQSLQPRVLGFLVYDSPWTDFLSLDSLKV